MFRVPNANICQAADTIAKHFCCYFRYSFGKIHKIKQNGEGDDPTELCNRCMRHPCRNF